MQDGLSYAKPDGIGVRLDGPAQPRRCVDSRMLICMYFVKLAKYPSDYREEIFSFRLSWTSPMSDYLGIPCEPEYYGLHTVVTLGRA